MQRRTIDAGQAAATTAITVDQAQAALEGLVHHGLVHAGSYRLAIGDHEARRLLEEARARPAE